MHNEEAIEESVEIGTKNVVDRPVLERLVENDESALAVQVHNVTLVSNDGESMSFDEVVGAASSVPVPNFDMTGQFASKNASNVELVRFHDRPSFVDFLRMPVPILQIHFYPDKWKILVVCCFLNCTRRPQVEKVVWKFFEKYPSPQALLDAPEVEIQEIIRPLGFYRRRTTAIKRLSEDFVAGNWKRPEDIRSVGVYAATCYRMMFEFEVGVTAPEDHALVDLWLWMRQEIKPRLGRLLPDVLR